MSSPIRPPLTIETVDGATEGRPINTIKVTNGDLTVSGTTATIDTSGSGGSPGLPAQSIQFNSTVAGTFTGSDRLLFETGSNNAQIFIKSGASATQAEIRAVDGWGLQIGATNADNSIRNQIALFGENDVPDGILLIPNTGQNVKLQTGGLTTSASDGNLVLSTYDDEDKAKITLEAGANGNILVQTDNTGVLQLENTTTNQNSILTVLGNGTGTPKAILKNASMEVDLTCEADGKLYIRDPTSGNRFVLDASTATSGIEFPDGTTLASAEGTAILSTGETGATKFLREDGDGTCSWQAAGGGGSSFKVQGFDSFTSGTLSYYHLMGFTSDTFGTVNSSPNTWSNSITRFRPMYARTTGSFSTAYVNITVAAASQVYGMEIGIYNSDADGNPSSLKCKATLATTATGEISASWVAESGQDLTCTNAELFWVGFARGDGATFQFIYNGQQSMLGYPSDSAASNLSGYSRYYASFTVQFPATITAWIGADSGAHLAMWTSYS